jgi:hypothetical protein
MLEINLDKENGIAVLSPHGKLSKDDFVNVAKVIDPYIDEVGKLNGIIIYTELFPGWDSFATMIKHLEFVKAHHKKVSHVALVTDSSLGEFGEHFANHFTSAEIKHFAFKEYKKAQKWILEAV